MSGPEFESFLAEVFVFLGYFVRRTGRSGDQGVDLVVGRNGVLVAVQAKCYVHPVSNEAVQEAYTGMTIYRCHRCAVVTSSTFTDGAREAARGVGCKLIDGSEICQLIRGAITL
jgi:HJR/Mrr/RecB family endonuclease